MLAPEQTYPQAIKYTQTVKRLKTTMCMHSWGKLWRRYQKKKKKKNPESITAISEEPGAKAGTWEQKQGTVCAPPLNTTKGEGKSPQPCLHPNPGHIPTSPS